MMDTRCRPRRARGAARLAPGFILLSAVLAPGIATAQLPATLPSADGTAAVAPAAGPSEITLPAVRALRLAVPTSGLPQPAGPATVSVATDVGAVPRRTTFSLRQVPADVTVDFDLPRGIISVAGTRVGSFTPVAPLTDNLKFPVDVTIQRGGSSVAMHRDIMLLLPTVIVPGFSNEKRTSPDPLVVRRFAQYGYTDAAPHPTLFWYPYQSHRIGLEEGAHALAAYVRRVVLPAAYAAKINVVGYSVGGLFARWLIAYDFDGWTALVNRLVMVAVPNEGAVMPYVGAHAPSFLPFAASAKTPLGRVMDPVFPFWRATAADPWSLPADDGNPALNALNARPFPAGLRLYNLYGNNDPSRTGGPQTAIGVTGQLPGATLSYGPGDGIVLTASALGLPINGSPGLPELAERAVRIDVGRVYHIHVLEVGAPKAAAVLQDRVETAAEAAGTPQHPQPSR
ncbi:MAG TPA: hypothetical protein VKT83_14890 [bacterium]|nr:hypothetical protein [bacterium]